MKKPTSKIILLIFSQLVLTGNLLFSQEDEYEEHHHSTNELGIANSIAYLSESGEFAYALHLHYAHNIGESHFAVGLGYERIFDEHKHNVIGLGIYYRPFGALNIALVPGIAFEGNDISEFFPVIHTEFSYDFELGKLHLGPLAGFAIGEEGYHLSTGIHVGLGF